MNLTSKWSAHLTRCTEVTMWVFNRWSNTNTARITWNVKMIWSKPVDFLQNEGEPVFFRIIGEYVFQYWRRAKGQLHIFRRLNKNGHRTHLRMLLFCASNYNNFSLFIVKFAGALLKLKGRLVRSLLRPPQNFSHSFSSFRRGKTHKNKGDSSLLSANRLTATLVNHY